MSEPQQTRLWDGSVGPSPPEPLIECSLAERRAYCIADLRIINAMIESQCRNCNAAGIDQLLGMICKHDIRRQVFALSDPDRRKLARRMREHEDVVVDPALLREEGWLYLMDCFARRRQLLAWLARYCNAFEVRE
jgi:hypothetical protein